MRWRKAGLLFDPGQHRLPDGCIGFAQSPQVLVLEGGFRIYFSTRELDATGKFLSHVAYVDVSHNLDEVIRVSHHTVIPPGGLGAFDEHGIFPMNVLRHGELVYAFTCGWNRRVSVSVDTAIGLAISRDGGETFERIGDGPVLGPSLHEPYLVGDAFVKYIDGIFHMWYIFGTSWRRYEDGASADRTYKIGHATSTDGVNWVKEEARQIIDDRLGAEESQALPTVVKVGGRYLMAFCYRQSFDFRRTPGRGYHLGFAWSDDLSNWDRNDNIAGLEAAPGDWDADMQCYPHLFEENGRIHLLYNGNDFGRGGFGLATLER